MWHGGFSMDLGAGKYPAPFFREAQINLRV